MKEKLHKLLKDLKRVWIVEIQTFENDILKPEGSDLHSIAGYNGGSQITSFVNLEKKEVAEEFETEFNLLLQIVNQIVQSVGHWTCIK